MAAIIPYSSIDQDAKVSRYFLPYQVAWINDDSRMRLVEKSVRIGWTWADAFKNVRKRLRHADRDYLFVTKDQPSAFEYVDLCKKFCEIFNITKSIVSHGIDDLKVPIWKDGKATGFTEEIRVGYIKFDNRSRILAFSSNPNAMRVYGGDVGADEYAFHPAAAELWETMQGRITWGHDLGMWSAHNGTDTQFNQFAQEAAAGQGGWTHYRITMSDALDMGLLDKINEVSGKNFTKDEFIQDCKNRARSEEVYEQAYNCNPKGSTSAIVSWAQIEMCAREYEIERVHMEASQVTQTFGDFAPEIQESREGRIQNFIKAAFSKHFDRRARHSLGFDVAASGRGDLCAIYLDERIVNTFMLRALFTCRTDDWNFIQTVLWAFMSYTTDVMGAGDETGLGRQICWETAKQFGGQFLQINFKSSKHDMGFALMNQLSVAEKNFPKSQKDIQADYFALRKLYVGSRWAFSEGRNSLNPVSHCDIAWSGGLSSKGGTAGTNALSVTLI